MRFESALRTLRASTFAVLALAACAVGTPAMAGKLSLVPVAPLDVAQRTAGAVTMTFAPTPVAKVAGGIVEVVEYHNAALDHYFISADPGELAVLDGGAFGGAWKRTGATFPAWDVSGSPAGTVPVCRFFGTDRYRSNGSRIGPNSHFYTADPAECDYVKVAWQSIANDGMSYAAWTFESNAFAVKLPVGGTCPAGTQALYRTYNDGARGDPNHRYSQQAATLQAMAGWVFEGIVMCLPQSQGVSLPSPLPACEEGDCPANSTALGNGVRLVNLIATVTNNSGTAQEIVIPRGQTFTSVDTAYQDGMAAERLQGTIGPGATRTFVLYVFCINLDRGIPPTGALYLPGPVTGNAQLLDIASLADGKIGVAADPATLKAGGVQFAIWEVTDGLGSLNTTQRNLLVSLLAAAPDDIAGQFSLLQQLQASLTILTP